MGLEDKIAIVGAGCRFPGADNLDEFWEGLINGDNHVKEIPAPRWNSSAFFDEDQTAPGKIYSDRELNAQEPCSLVGEVEACRVDPQQRYVLECVHMALEDGGISRKQINGTNTGVIIGSMNDDYKVMANSDLTELRGYTATGTASSVVAARVSYVYNLHGTCLTLDTACSSALIAIHLASQAIQTGNSDMVICGVLGCATDPGRARMISSTDQRPPFYGTNEDCYRAEGCGVLLLKSLKAALEDGNKIWATVKKGRYQDCPIANPVRAPSISKKSVANGTETWDTTRSGIDKDGSMAEHDHAPSDGMRVELLKDAAGCLNKSRIQYLETACPLPEHLPLYLYNRRGVLFTQNDIILYTFDQYWFNQTFVESSRACPETSFEMYLNSTPTCVLNENFLSRGLFVPGSVDINPAILLATGRFISEFDDIYLEMKYISLLLNGSNDRFVSCSDVPAFPTTSLIPSRIIVLSKYTDKTWLTAPVNYIHIISVTFGNNDNNNNNNIFVPNKMAHKNTIFIVHTCGSTESIAKDKMFDTSIQMFYDIKALLSVLKASTIASSVAVITENTQSCPGRATMSDHGSELWGMIRSAAREAGYTRLVLIDVDRNNVETDLLLWLLFNANEDAHEFVLSGSTVFQPNHDNEQSNVTCKRVIFITELGKMALTSDIPREITEDCLRMPCVTHSLLDGIHVICGHPISNSIHLPCDINRYHLVRTDAVDIRITDGKDGNDNKELDVICIFPVTDVLTSDIHVVHLVNCYPTLTNCTNAKQLQEFVILAHKAYDTASECCNHLDHCQRALLNLLRKACGSVHVHPLTVIDRQNDGTRFRFFLIVKKEIMLTQRINELIRVLPRSIRIMLQDVFFSNIPFEKQIIRVSLSNSCVSEVNTSLKELIVSTAIMYLKHRVDLSDSKDTACEGRVTSRDAAEVIENCDNVIVTLGNLTQGVASDNNRCDMELTETGNSYGITTVTPAYKDRRIQKSITYTENIERQLSDGGHRNDKTVLINGRFKREIEITKKDVILSGRFDKQTSRGWDHKVDVSLAYLDGRVVLEWGKERRFRKNHSKALEIKKIKDVVLKDLNGIPSLIIKAKRRTLVFKTPDRIQANLWLEAFKGTMRISLKK